MTRSYPEIETGNGIVHSTTRGDGLHSGAGNTLFREVGGRFSFGIIVGDVCAMSWDTSARGNQEKPSLSLLQITKWKDYCRMLHRQFVRFVAVTMQSAAPSVSNKSKRAFPSKEKLCARKRSGGDHLGVG